LTPVTNSFIVKTMKSEKTLLDKSFEDLEGSQRIWDKLKGEFSDLSDADFAFLRKNLPDLNLSVSADKWLAANEKLIQRIKVEIERDGESNLVRPIAAYAEKGGIGKGGVWCTLKLLYDAYRETEGKLNIYDAVSFFARILTQEKVINYEDRNVQSITLELLNSTDFTKVPESEKKEVLEKLKYFIENFKTVEQNEFLFGIEDVADAILAGRKIDPNFYCSLENGKRAGPWEVAEDILRKTGVSWERSEKEFYPSPTELIDELIEAPDFIDEELEKQIKRIPEPLIEQATHRAFEVVGYLEEIPEGLKPAIRLHIFNDYIQREDLRGEDGGIKQEREIEKRFRSFIEEEKKAEENPYLPTIGLEIEVPQDFWIQINFFKATTTLGIPVGFDEAWEFATNFSHSARAQSLLVHELIRGGFIETTGDDKSKKIRGEGDFSLHLNIGVPPELKLTHKEIVEKINFKADILTNALTYGFVSPERLNKRKTATRLKLKEGIDAEKKKKIKREVKNEQQAQEAEALIPPNEKLWQRIEIRSLEVRDKTLYRLLIEAQNLGAAFLSSLQKEPDETEKKLTKVWCNFEKEIMSVLSEKSLNLDDIDRVEPKIIRLTSEPIKAIKALVETDIQQRMREIITKNSLEVSKILEEKS
jgi:hypothetical protein